jgi:hypothetical protein
MSVTYISTLLCLRLILTLSQTFFKQSVLSAQASLAFHSGSCNIRYKTQRKRSKAPNDKPNGLKHVRHSVPKLQQTQSLYQTVSNACQFNSTTVCPG